MKLTSYLPLITVASAAFIPGDNFSTFTPDGGFLPSATTDYASTFGIAINAITSSVSLTSVVSGTPVPSTDDGSDAKAGIITQIGDGQIQAPTSTPSPTKIHQIVTQIGDGQIQAATTTVTPSTTSSTTTTAPTTANVVTQIGDGQIQNQAPASATSDDDVTYVTVTPTETVMQTVTSATMKFLPAETVTVHQKRELDYACASDEALSMTLESSVLRDSKGRVGSIVSNRQFQFDGPVPQAGAIYTSGWSIVDGKLALGTSTTFYQCLSGDFYNLYDEKVAEQCTAVELDVVNIINC